MPQRKVVGIICQNEERFDILRNMLRFMGYEANRLLSALSIGENYTYDAIIELLNSQMDPSLGCLLPIKKQFPYLAVIIVDETSTISTAVEAMRSGATDYVSFAELDLMKLQNILKIVEQSYNQQLTANKTSTDLPKSKQSVLQFGDFIIDLNRQLALYKQLEINLSATEFDILSILIKYRGHLIQYEEIYYQIKDVKVDARQARQSLATHISNLRKKMRVVGCDHLLITVRGIGIYIDIQTDYIYMSYLVGYEYLLKHTLFDYIYLFEVDPDSKMIFRWVVGSFKSVTGFIPTELAALGGWKHLIHPEDVSVTQRRCLTLLSGNDDISEFRIITKDNDTRWLQDHGWVIKDRKLDRITHIYGAAKDITNLKFTD